MKEKNQLFTFDASVARAPAATTTVLIRCSVPVCVCVCLCVVLHLFVQYRSSHHSTPGLSLLSWQPLFLPHHFRINLIAEVCLSSSSTGDKCRGRRDEWTDEWLLTFIDRGVLSPSCFFLSLASVCVCVFVLLLCQEQQSAETHLLPLQT